ncbi:MAG: hypothetical protein JWN23_2916 [Rhodocyclales bacterium]|nr:hypothetical protein [Rhodocyclales bacterium]
MRYRRSHVQGGTWFFRVNLADRTSNMLIENVETLREVIRSVRQAHPFEIIAMVVMPEHLHAIWQLPPDDADYPMRWSLIKAGFSRRLIKTEQISESRAGKRERGIWQRRYWEHQIRDDADLGSHVDYIHFNPVKHGYVKRAADWPHSSIHRFIKLGWVSPDWGGRNEIDGAFGE